MEFFLTKEKMEKLTTRRLIEYRNKLLSYPENANWEMSGSARITKMHPSWQEAYVNIKAVLATREHVPSKKEI